MLDIRPLKKPILGNIGFIDSRIKVLSIIEIYKKYKLSPLAVIGEKISVRRPQVFNLAI